MGYWVYGTLSLAAVLFVTALAMIMAGAPVGLIVAVVTTLWLMGVASLIGALLIFGEPWFRRLVYWAKGLIPIDRRKL